MASSFEAVDALQQLLVNEAGQTAVVVVVVVEHYNLLGEAADHLDEHQAYVRNHRAEVVLVVTCHNRAEEPGGVLAVVDFDHSVQRVARVGRHNVHSSLGRAVVQSLSCYEQSQQAEAAKELAVDDEELVGLVTMLDVRQGWLYYALGHPC